MINPKLNFIHLKYIYQITEIVIQSISVYALNISKNGS